MATKQMREPLMNAAVERSPTETLSPQQLPPTIPPHILVALDTSPHSLAALRAAARLAAVLQIELHGLFIEDDQLLQLCHSSFSREVDVLTAQVRPLESSSVERKMRIAAIKLRQLLAGIAAEVQVQWTFHVRRGGIDQELLIEAQNAAQNAVMLSLGRTNRFTARGLGSTARRLAGGTMSPLLLLGPKEEWREQVTVIYDGSPSARRALALAAQLTQLASQPVTVLLIATVETDTEAHRETGDALHAQVADTFHAQHVAPQIMTINDWQEIGPIIRDGDKTLILPVDYVDLLGEVKGPVVLVP